MPATTTPGANGAGTSRRRIAGDRRRGEIEIPDRAEVLSSRDAPVVVPVKEADEQPAPARAAFPVADAAADRRLPRWVMVALAACLVAVVAASVLATMTTRADRADLRAGDAALAVAKTSAATILSYDYRHLDADFSAAAALTTGSFRTDYQATTAKAVKQLATQTQAVVAARVVAGGVVSSTTGRVTVLLFVNQTTTSNRLSSARTDLNRVQMTMTRSGSRWLVSSLKAL